MSNLNFQMFALLSVAGLCPTAFAQKPSAIGTFKVLFAPPGSGIGGLPVTLFEGQPGIFYGNGSFMPSGLGATVFSIDTAGSYKTIYQAPANNLVEAVIGAENGLLYGYGAALQQGGAGPEYFSMKFDGSSLKTYPTGAFGVAGSFAIPSPAGYLYDVMNCPNCTLTRIDLQGHITAVYQFSTVGLVMYGGSTLVQGKPGIFYGLGVVPNNGSKVGTIFRVTSSGVYTKLANFEVSATGDTTAPLTYASDGNLYGGFAKGGTHHRGSVYRVTPQGKMTTVIDFPVTGIASPAVLMQADDGYIYGNTNQIPSFFFRFDPANPVLDILHEMSTAEGICGCLFFQGSDGKFYGAAATGGLNGFGTIFSFDAGLAPPKPAINSFSPASGAPGTQVLLWGNNLLGATSVTFKGTPAVTLLVTSQQSVFVDVPKGATTGPLTITTPNGSYTTSGSFTIQ